MNAYELLFAGGAAAAVVILVAMATGRTGSGKWQIAAFLSAGFMAFSLIPILGEGPIGFVANHIVNYWGVQVFYDLVLALSCAVFFAAPRARKAGMNLAPWLIPVLLLGSIGLLALMARLFWLEEQALQVDPV